MVDTRFHRFAGSITIGALLAELGRQDLVASLADPDRVVSGVNELELAGPDDLVLAAHPSYAADLRRTKAGLALISQALVDDVPQGTLAIVTPKTHNLFADILERLYPSSTRSVILGQREDLGAPIFERDVTIGSNVVVGAGVEIGRGTVIGANTVIGPGVTIGRNCTIASNCTIDCTHIGNEVVIHAGVRLGTEGFGWLDHGSANKKIPQLGRVIVQDRVEIGANSTIDRGALGDTVIGDGTKIDNLVQIGHNCRIGRNCLIAAMSGLSGSTIVEDGVLMGGGVGTSGHLRIGAGSVVHGRAAVTKDWPAGSKLAGAPAQDIRDFWREMAAMRKLSKGDKRV
ncbi:MAG: UDP-3-O-(3-hydroxymyristoyl)glucosamine N-acyltransferase [Devosia sp.]|jgi:UDP-3-O-[3-hydroxymyristoyl] glucosamine N-acyltransferase|uniref:UDP-3-O-(3-hydroxymyristoyl)glucosamine N-acyltransferase n=1 Tax=unclassified Devosia TaxID=196773 RepID=UPI0019F55A41|nr:MULTISPECIES: UDP-3-O-(3-hydroxymyristoyl)glucosamine N-acyltransferase [unclassified Devosia]MBF0678175.1 UDP-3-O-(3-hydroxymyristoyl)glucosamine N-acyltransferase [Devosia sp.]WEJ31433.1 UDP-3-O-(3-hydroxymyristoyl)glucosamine N-acyltransferase [Devosia sp. SD17-2]